MTNCEHRFLWGKKSIYELIDMFNSFESDMAQVRGLHDISPIIIRCDICGEKWKLVWVCNGIRTEQFRIYKDGHIKRYKNSTSTTCCIVSKGWKYIFNPKDTKW